MSEQFSKVPSDRTTLNCRREVQLEDIMGQATLGEGHRDHRAAQP